MPFSELDALYRHIFSSLDDPEKALQLLAFDILSVPGYIDNVGYMEDILSISHGGTEISLCDLGSVVQVIEHDLVGDRSLHIFHASLEDFLLDKSRSGAFWLDAASRHAEFAQLYIKYFLDAANIKDLSYPNKGLLDLGYHIRKASPTPALKDDIVSFFKDFLFVKTRAPKSLLHSGTRKDTLRLFRDAIKESQFEGVFELRVFLELEHGVFMEE